MTSDDGRKHGFRFGALVHGEFPKGPRVFSSLSVDLQTFFAARGEIVFDNACRSQYDVDLATYRLYATGLDSFTRSMILASLPE